MMINTIKDFLWVLVRPICWISIYMTEPHWDKFINELLDTETSLEIGMHSITIGKLQIWTSNYPYAYGNEFSSTSDGIPKRRTRHRLKEYVASERVKCLVRMVKDD